MRHNMLDIHAGGSQHVCMYAGEILGTLGQVCYGRWLRRMEQHVHSSVAGATLVLGAKTHAHRRDVGTGRPSTRAWGSA
ncbi:hypothetical protein TorRG33x02_294890 [Trema orientale]|uniref:Uncharacterized protein n=1 Tax=Trema orientale TaxID=63057 RepID=A0A2P5C725_TREOI|nr:hypothetical protein TorRG33x02_294890 [Trema orientale]